MTTQQISLTEQDARFILEALHDLQAKWQHINQTTQDEDEQADVGNDLLSLSDTVEEFQKQSITAFGPKVADYDRAPLLPDAASTEPVAVHGN